MRKKCEGCEYVDEAQLKELKEMMKKRAKPEDCPYLKTCTQKVLKQEAELMCKDQEITQEAIMVHMNGHHMWELCQVYHKAKQEREGKLPRDWT